MEKLFSEAEVILTFAVQVNNILSVHGQIMHFLSLFPSKVNTEFNMKLPLCKDAYNKVRL